MFWIAFQKADQMCRDVYSKRHPKAEFSWKTTSHERPRFTVKSPETRVMSPEIHPACFVSPQHHCLRNETYLQNYPACFVSLSLKERDILHTLFIKISGDLSKNFGRHDSGFERYNFGRLDRSPRPLHGHILGGRLRRFDSIALQFNEAPFTLAWEQSQLCMTLICLIRKQNAPARYTNG